MMTIPWLVVLILVVFGVIVTLALHQRRDVRAGFKIPFATFFFEASGHEKDPTPSGQTTLQVAEERAKSDIIVEKVDAKGRAI